MVIHKLKLVKGLNGDVTSSFGILVIQEQDQKSFETVLLYFAKLFGDFVICIGIKRKQIQNSWNFNDKNNLKLLVKSAYVSAQFSNYLSGQN